MPSRIAGKFSGPDKAARAPGNSRLADSGTGSTFLYTVTTGTVFGPTIFSRVDGLGPLIAPGEP